MTISVHYNKRDNNKVFFQLEGFLSFIRHDPKRGTGCTRVVGILYYILDLRELLNDSGLPKALKCNILPFIAV